MTEAEWDACTDPQPMLEFLRGKMASQDECLPSGVVIQVPVYPDCKVSDRKMRLFSCACVRRIWHLLTDEQSRKAIEVTESFVDDLATQHEHDEATTSAQVVAESQYAVVWDAADQEAAASDDPDATHWVHGAHECASSASAAAHAAWYAAGLSCAPGDAVDAPDKAVFAVAHAASPLLFTEDCNPDFTLRQSVEGAEKAVQAALLRCIVGPFLFRPVTINYHALVARRLAQAIYTDRAFDRLPILADALEDAGCTDPDILAHCRGPGPHVRGCWVVDLLTGRQ